PNTPPTPETYTFPYTTLFRSTTKNTMAALEGYRQLRADHSQRVPDMLRFVLARLNDTNDPLFEKFLDYLKDRQDTTKIETFLIRDRKSTRLNSSHLVISYAVF